MTHRLTLICRFSILALIFAGCPVESINPLSKLGESKHDGQLTGTWLSTGESGEAWYLHIGKGDLELGPGTISIAPSHAISVRHQTGGGVSLGTFKIFPAEIAEQKYASIKFAGTEDNGLGYLLLKYSIDQNLKLSLWIMDEKIARDGKLTYSRSKVTDSTANLRAVLASESHAELFSSAPDFVFERIAPR